MTHFSRSLKKKQKCGTTCPNFMATQRKRYFLSQCQADCCNFNVASSVSPDSLPFESLQSSRKVLSLSEVLELLMGCELRSRWNVSCNTLQLFTRTSWGLELHFSSKESSQRTALWPFVCEPHLVFFMFGICMDVLYDITSIKPGRWLFPPRTVSRAQSLFCWKYFDHHVRYCRLQQ